MKNKIDLQYPKGATPLDPNEVNGLIPNYIKTQADLNKLEQENILEAQNWALKKKHDDVLTYSFLLKLHKKMFGKVWRWAGSTRTSEKSIGIFKEQIPGAIKSLLDDTKYWIEHKTYPWDKIAARFHHRPLHTHMFANGNGRHARLMTDILLEVNDQEPFSWGRNSSESPIDIEGPIREKYVSSLKKADAGDFDPLMKFVKS